MQSMASVGASQRFRLPSTLNNTTQLDLSVPQSQNTAPVFDYHCMYTHDVRRKNQKRWHDGYLSFHTFNKRVMVYDDQGHSIGSTHVSSEDQVQDGEEFSLEKGACLVQVGECKAKRNTDLKEVLKQKPNTPVTKERPRSLQAINANRTQHCPSATKWTGQARLPIQSPFEVRQGAQENASEWNEPPAAKRQRRDDSQHVPLASVLRTSKPSGKPAAARPAANFGNKKPATKTAPSQNVFKVQEVIDITASPEIDTQQEKTTGTPPAQEGSQTVEYRRDDHGRMWFKKPNTEPEPRVPPSMKLPGPTTRMPAQVGKLQVPLAKAGPAPRGGNQDYSAAVQVASGVPAKPIVPNPAKEASSTKPDACKPSIPPVKYVKPAASRGVNGISDSSPQMTHQEPPRNVITLSDDATPKSIRSPPAARRKAQTPPRESPPSKPARKRLKLNAAAPKRGLMSIAKIQEEARAREAKAKQDKRHRSVSRSPSNLSAAPQESNPPSDIPSSSPDPHLDELLSKVASGKSPFSTKKSQPARSPHAVVQPNQPQTSDIIASEPANEVADRADTADLLGTADVFDAADLDDSTTNLLDAPALSPPTDPAPQEPIPGVQPASPAPAPAPAPAITMPPAQGPADPLHAAQQPLRRTHSDISPLKRAARDRPTSNLNPRYALSVPAGRTASIGKTSAVAAVEQGAQQKILGPQKEAPPGRTLRRVETISVAVYSKTANATREPLVAAEGPAGPWTDEAWDLFGRWPAERPGPGFERFAAVS